MSNAPPPSRRTSGRTHRILLEAVNAAREERSVLVLVKDKNDEHRIKVRIEGLTTDEEVQRRITVRAYVDLEKGSVLAGSRFSAVFEDHEVQERRAAQWEAMKLALTT